MTKPRTNPTTLIFSYEAKELLRKAKKAKKRSYTDIIEELILVYLDRSSTQQQFEIINEKLDRLLDSTE